jgi:hypothetical protein
MSTFELPTEEGTRSWAALRHAAVARGARGLARGGLIHAEIPAGGYARCQKGCVWVTADTVSGDIILHAGESRQFARHSRVLVEALEDSRVRLGA